MQETGQFYGHAYGTKLYDVAKLNQQTGLHISGIFYRIIINIRNRRVLLLWICNILMDFKQRNR